MTGDIPKRVLWYSVDEPLPEQTHLRAGPLSLIYTAGDLRSIQLGDQVILDRIYVAVRDPNWGTVPAMLPLMVAAYLQNRALPDREVARLIPWREGAFDVVVDGDLVRSMYREGGFPENEIITRAVRERLGR